MAIVFWDIAETERQLRLSPWLAHLWAWLSEPGRRLLRRFGVGRRVIQVSGSSSATSSGEARITVLRARGNTVKERLASMQLQLDDQRRELDDLASQVSEDRRAFRQSIADADARLTTELAQLTALVTGLSAGSIRWRVAGGVLILLGTGLIVVGQFLL